MEELGWGAEWREDCKYVVPLIGREGGGRCRERLIGRKLGHSEDKGTSGWEREPDIAKEIKKILGRGKIIKSEPKGQTEASTEVRDSGQGGRDIKGEGSRWMQEVREN